MEKIPGGCPYPLVGLPVRVLGQGLLSRLLVGRAQTHAHGRKERQQGGQGEVSSDRPYSLGGSHRSSRPQTAYTLAMISPWMEAPWEG